MIVYCHFQAKRYDQVVKFASRVLEYDANSFQALSLLSFVHYEWEEYDKAAYYIRQGLKNFPEPSPEFPKFIIRFIQFMGLFSARFQHIASELGKLGSPRIEWMIWANNYLEWYGRISRNQEAVEWDATLKEGKTGDR